MILLEAMGCGKPVVATQIEGYRELLGESEAGALVPPADPGALAKGIETVLGDPDGYRKRCAVAGRCS